MSEFDLSVLCYFRVFGPCHCDEVAGRMRKPTYRVHLAVQRLAAGGHLAHVRDLVWDVSRKGRDWFARLVEGVAL